ncbi:TonB-dependent receptor [Pseudofulvibacter geojedonensis]|uniref:TonB-dependent receptor n=1 Tax=Pseudofulvibacter geojedonensis TaxID=1123758 RepID=A0ABW3HY80_9FLAO
MKNCALFLLLLLSQLVSSQNCNSTYLGEVKDFHDGSPLYGATIHLKELNKYAATDINGKFKFQNLCDGTITVLVSHIGCETKETQVIINGDSFSSINLEHHTEELDEVNLHGNSGKKKTLTSQETVLKKDVLENYSSGSLGDALKEVTGVSSVNTGNAIVKPVINGLHSSRITIINNGVRLQDQDWGIEHAPNIDINSVESVTVVKGSGALAYGGDAIGGVVILNPNKFITKDSLFGKSILTAQSNGRGGSLTSSLTKTFEKGWFVSGQGTYKQLGDFHAPDYILTNTGVKTKAISLSTGYKKFEKGFDVYYSYINNSLGILSASHIGNAQDLLNAINNSDPLITEDFSYKINSPRQDVSHHLIKTNFYKRFENLGKLSLQYDYQNNKRFEFDKRVGDDRNKPAVDLTLQTHSILSDFKFDANNNRVFHAGVLTRYQDNFANPDTGVRRLIPDYQKIDLGAYITSLFKLNSKLSIDAGLRYDFNRIDAKKFYQESRWNSNGYNEDFSDIIIDDNVTGNQLLVNPIFNYHNISISTGLMYNINKKSHFSFNYTLSNRAPNPSELFSDGLHHSAARIELGDLRIKQEHSNRFSTSYNFNNDKFSINSELFLNSIKDFIYLEPTGSEFTIRGEFPVWEYKQTNALLFGLDANLQYQLNSNWIVSNKTSFVHGEDKKNKRSLIDMPPFNTVTSFTFNKGKWLDLTCTLKSELVVKQNRYPNNNFEVYIPQTDSNELIDISSTPAGYHLLHFISSIKVYQESKTPIEIGVNVNNLLNTSYRNYLNRLRYFSDDIGRNMMISLKINY